MDTETFTQATGPMVAVVRHNRFDTERLAAASDQWAAFDRAHRAQPGYAGSAVVDVGDGERIMLTLWASEEHAADARATLGPVVKELLTPLERAPSRLLGAGPVVTTDLTLSSPA